MNKYTRPFIYGIIFIIVMSIIYIVSWQLIINSELFVTTTQNQPTAGGSTTIVGMSDKADVLVMRYGFLPMYWTRMNPPYLGQYHTVFFILVFLITGVYIRVSILREKRRITY